MPCKKHPIREYKCSLEEIETTLYSYIGRGNIVLMGDFNTQIPIRTDSLKMNLDTRGKLLCQSLLALNLILVNCLPLCKGPE